MRLWLKSIVLGFGFALTGCVEASNQPAPEITVAPTEFAILPCAELVGEQPCALVIVGGKRLLFGAPAGVTLSLRAEDLKQLDAVLLFSLRSRDTQGLDEIRNQSWEAGRETPLLVIGPDGVGPFVNNLNKAYEMADALRIVEDGIPAGGFDAAVLTAHTGRQQTVFNTGDVVVMRSGAGYSITYLEQNTVWLASCRGDAAPMANVYVWCDPDQGEATWPLTEPIFVELFSGAE